MTNFKQMQVDAERALLNVSDPNSSYNEAIANALSTKLDSVYASAANKQRQDNTVDSPRYTR